MEGIEKNEQINRDRQTVREEHCRLNMLGISEMRGMATVWVYVDTILEIKRGAAPGCSVEYVNSLLRLMILTAL